MQWAGVSKQPVLYRLPLRCCHNVAGVCLVEAYCLTMPALLWEASEVAVVAAVRALTVCMGCGRRIYALIREINLPRWPKDFNIVKVCLRCFNRLKGWQR